MFTDGGRPQRRRRSRGRDRDRHRAVPRLARRADAAGRRSCSPRSTASSRRSSAAVRARVPRRRRHGLDVGRRGLVGQRLREDSIDAGLVRLGQRGYDGRPRAPAWDRRGCRVPGGRRRGPGRDRARAEAVHRPHRGVHGGSAAHARCDGSGASARGRDRRRHIRPQDFVTVTPSFSSATTASSQDGMARAAVLRADRVLGGGGDRLADGRRAGDGHRLRVAASSTRWMDARRPSSWRATST